VILVDTSVWVDHLRSGDARVAALLALHPALQALIPQERIELVSRSAIRAVNSLQDWALSVDDPEQANEIIGEMKTLLKGYLAVYLDQTVPKER